MTQTLTKEKPLEWSELGIPPVETIAMEAKRILSLVPEDKWCKFQFHDPDTGKSCAIGWYHRSKNMMANDLDEDCVLREPSRLYLNSIGIGYNDIADINNDDENTRAAYPQPTPKQRVMALLDDMIAAGY